MSHWNDFETTITNKDALVRALCRCTNKHKQQITSSMIEVHETPVTLNDYMGRPTNRTANIIIRHNNVGSCANDMGFTLEDGKYKAIIDEAHYFNQEWQNRLYTFCNIEVSKIELEAKKIEYKETVDSKGRIQIKAKFKATNKPNQIKVGL